MNVKGLIAAVCGIILKGAAAVFAIMVIYRGAIMAYEYGYRVFEEPAMASGEGRVVSVTVTEDMSPREMGQLFLSKGLIRDEKLFILQYYLSEFRKDIKAGDFDLNTAMTVEEMMEAMTKEPVAPSPAPAGMDDLPRDVTGPIDADGLPEGDEPSEGDKPSEEDTPSERVE